MADDRYSRQVLFPSIGETGQEKLREKHVLLVGAGALGTGNAESLVRSGIGQITIIDRDYVELSNLQRQQLYSENDAERQLPKAVAAKKRLLAINSNVIINSEVNDFLSFDIEQKVKDIDLIIDATDNFETRLYINDIAQKYRKPWIFGACVGSTGMTCTFIPEITPCFHCLWKELPNLNGQTCDTVGVINPAVNMVVSNQVAEALKILVEDYHALDGKLKFFDLWQNIYSTINLKKVKDKNCPSCGSNRTHPYLLREYHMKSAVLCGRNSVQIRPPQKRELNLKLLEDKLLKQGIEVKGNSFLISINLSSQRMVIFKDGRVLIHGTKDISVAKRLYYKFFN